MVGFILGVAASVDRLIGQPTLRDLVCYFYTAHEGISIRENAGRLWVCPSPKS